jgi:hypothetical protein
VILRVLLAALGATFGWGLGILVGSTIGGAIGVFVSPFAGRAIGGLLAGAIAGAIESRANTAMRGKRLRFTGATAVMTAIVTVLLVDVHILFWLVGAAFGAATAAAQAKALGLARRDAILRVLTSSAAWSLGFLVLDVGGKYGKIGLIAPGLAAVVFALATLSAERRRQRTQGIALQEPQSECAASDSA